MEFLLLFYWSQSLLHFKDFMWSWNAPRCLTIFYQTPISIFSLTLQQHLAGHLYAHQRVSGLSQSFARKVFFEAVIWTLITTDNRIYRWFSHSSNFFHLLLWALREYAGQVRELSTMHGEWMKKLYLFYYAS